MIISENRKWRRWASRLEADPARITRVFEPSSFLWRTPGLGGLAAPRRPLGTQPLDLAPWQGDADLADPFQFHPVDRLGVEAGEVDEAGGFAPLDGFQVTLAGLQPDRGLFPIEARWGVALLPVDHDNIAIFVLGQHGIAGHLKGDGFLGNREGQFDLAEAFRRHLLVFRLDDGAGADPAHDRYRVEFEIIDDGLDFRRLDQTDFRQDFRNRAGADAHRNGQTTLGLARLLQSPLDHPDVQHAGILLNFRSKINSDFQKSDLTGISEYQKIAVDSPVVMTRNAGGSKCNRQAGRPSIRKRCGNISSGACPILKSQRRSMRNSEPAIPAAPRSAAASGWDWPAPTGPPTFPSRRRKPAGRGFTSCANATRPNPAGQNRSSNLSRR